jgi:RNA-directed DNA polymerase
VTEAKPFKISKVWLYTSYLKIRANGGTYGVDRESLEMFEQNREDNLYKIWNRMSSGSYMPPAVRRIEILKKGGGTRPLGIPTVSDRIAQMVVREHLEPKCEVVFHGDSYAYRPNRSAHNAIRKASRRCLEYSWVIDLDIKSFFDSIPHDLLMKAVRRHTQESWILLYIERWLTAPVQLANGEMEARTRGTPQGSVISPLLANLFLHYAFDEWMNRNITYCPFERYADDIVVHCSSLMQANYIRAKIEERLKETGLVLHPQKTVIVYCIHGKDNGAANGYPLTQFDFLGFTFTTRSIRNFRKQINAYRIFSPAISMKAKVAIMNKVRSWRIRRQTNLDLEELSEMTNASIRGWIAYYGAFGRRELYRVFQNINGQLIGWMKKKYRISSARVANRWLEKVTKNAPHLFAHWELLNCKTVGQ